MDLHQIEGSGSASGSASIEKLDPDPLPFAHDKKNVWNMSLFEHISRF
jgi:hypothetical protein